MGQRILVFQRDGMGEGKVRAVARMRPDLELSVVDVTGPVAAIEDHPEAYFPANLRERLRSADLVLDHLYHPDLTGYLIDRCDEAHVPVVASGRKLPRAHTPITCCTLGRIASLGAYAEAFGAPELEVEVVEGKLSAVRVLRGAPCEATWKAAENVIGLPIEEAITRMGLEVQFHCYAKANPNVFLTNPLHVAGEVHSAALQKALKASASS